MQLSRLIKTVVIAAVASTLTIASATSAHAASPEMRTATPVPAIDQDAAAQSPTTAALQPYVTFSAAGWRLDAPTAILSAVPAADLAAIEAHIAETNKDIKAGTLVMQADGTAAPTAATSSERTFRPMTRFNGPHGYIEDHWYGWKVHLDKFYTDKLSIGLGAVGGIAGLAAALGATGPAAGIIGAAAVLMVAEVNICKKESGDVYLYIITIGSLSVVCNPL